MYKKMKWPFLFMVLFSVSGAMDIIAQSNPKPPPPPPPAHNLIRGNWNHLMDPTGCVILDDNNKLTIFVRISVGKPDVSPFAGLYYKTQFQNGPVTIEGPITNAMLTEEVLPTGCEVYTFVKEVYNESFNQACMLNPDDPISFDYHISLVDVNGDPYPLEENIGIVKSCQAATGADTPGSTILPTIVYEGNHDLCCSELNMGGQGFVVNQNDGHEILNDRVFEDDANPDFSNQEIQVIGSDAASLNENEVIDISIYPNPFQETLNIQFKTKNATRTTVQIWNINGQLVSELKLETLKKGMQEVNLSTSDLPADIYFCKIKNDNLSQTLKVIKL